MVRVTPIMIMSIVTAHITDDDIIIGKIDRVFLSKVYKFMG